MTLTSRLAVRALQKNKTSTIVTLTGIVLSFALMFSVMLFADSFVPFYRARTEMIHGPVELFIDEVDKDTADSIVMPPEVRHFARTARLGVSTFADDGSNMFYHVVGVSPTVGALMPFHLKEGRLPERDGEAVVSQSVYMSDAAFAGVGATIQRPLMRQELQRNGDAYELKFIPLDDDMPVYTVVGIAKNNPLSPGDFRPAVYTYMSDGDIAASPIQQLRIQTGMADAASIDRAVSVLEQTPGASVFRHSELLEMYPGFTSMAKVLIYAFATVFLIIVGLAGIGLVQNAFLIAFTRRARELSLLASVGMTSRQRSRLAFREGLMLYIVALPLGFLLAWLAMTILYAVLNPILRSIMDTEAGLAITLNPLTVLLIAGLGLLVVLFGSLLPVLKSRRLSPIAGVRRHGDVKVSLRTVHVPRWLKRTSGFAGELAWKNMKRNKKPFRATLVSIVFSLVLYLTLASILQFAGNNIRSGGPSEFHEILIFSEGTGSILETQGELERLLDIPAIKASLTVYSLPADVQYDGYVPSEDLADDPDIYKNARFIAFDSQSMQRMYAQLGLKEPLNTDEAILVNRLPMRRENRLITPPVFSSSPDSVLATSVGRHGQSEKQLAIVRSENEILDVYNDWQANVTYVVATETLTTWNAEAVSSMTYIDAKDADYSELLTELQAGILAKKLPLGVQDLGDYNRQSRDLLLLSRIILFGFATVIGLIGILNLYNSLISSLQYRRREFAMLRAVGMSNKTTAKMIRIESLFYAVKLLVFGIPIAIGLSYVFYRYLSRTMEFTFRIPILHYAIASAIVILLVYALMQIGTKIARKSVIAEELKRLSDN